MLHFLTHECVMLNRYAKTFLDSAVKSYWIVHIPKWSDRQVLKMETQVLKASEFQLFAPTTKTFLRYLLMY